MNIKDKIIEWQEQVKDEFCINDAERMVIDQELKLVLFAFDSLTNLKSPKHNENDALRIRSQAGNSMLCDSKFLKMINGETPNDT